MKVVILDYGAGNTQSVYYALKRAGVSAILSSDVEEITKANAVIFPGVGHAKQAKSQLQEKGLWQLIPTLTQPVLGICLGMQLMANSSEEGDVTGLGIIDTKVVRFSEKLGKVPHMGWNTVNKSASNSLLLSTIDNGDYAYFVHSYYMENNANTIATSNFQVSFTAAVQQNNFFGCQFHPEKSGSVGDLILNNFLTLARTWK